MSTPHSHLPIGKLAAERLDRGSRVGACPDAELLAAYVDGGLSEPEVAAVDAHLATCPACRALLAALSPVEAVGTAAPRLVSFTPRLDWKWLSAAATLAVAAVLWFALPRPELAQAPPPVAQPAVAESSVPIPTAAPDGPAQRDAGGKAEADRESADPARSAPAGSPAAGEVARQDVAPSAPPAKSPASKDEAFRSRSAPQDARSRAAAVPPPPSEGAGSRPEAQAVDRRAQALLAERVRQKAMAAQRERESRLRRDRSAEETTEAKIAAAANRSPLPAAPEPAAATGAAAGVAAPAQAVSVTAGRASADTAIATATFAEPEGRLRWRIVGGHVLESSSDGGATWTRRLLHRSDRLLAGSAPDLGTTWVVGARGTVFRRSVPGEWEKVASPTDGTLVAVTAPDARRARVATQDGRRFETADGGVTWTPVPE